ncbi:hypothetical protein LOD99_1658 [Oopsacas minuta]|uniref:Uncharacterized protein n=1 Tax=Oopsacas minuta TaxID=111878 RepID=A0AAV7K644_9METZ|nr:hypothetical protein LOD99_1658 [Oopsacas minuta]
MNIFASILKNTFNSFVIFLITSLWLVEGQDDNVNSDPALFFAIIVVVVVIAVVLVGAIISLVVICVVYYCCTPVPVPVEPRPQVRTNPEAGRETPPRLSETLPPGYDTHQEYPRGNFSERSRASLPRYSLIFKKSKRSRGSERSRASDRTTTRSNPPDVLELTLDEGTTNADN